MINIKRLRELEGKATEWMDKAKAACVYHDSRLTPLRYLGYRGSCRYFRVRCLCGKEKDVRYDHIVGGKIRSCGCLSIERPWRITHGRSNSKVYKTYLRIKLRCFKEQHPDYPDYGGRGITMCARWQNSFEAFLEDMGEPPSPHHSIDRINPDGSYEPGNCRWATNTEQQNNKRNNIYIIIGGQKRSMADWCRHFNVNYGIARQQYVRYKWPIERVFPLKQLLSEMEGE